MKNALICSILGLFFISCGPRIVTKIHTKMSPLDYRQEVNVLNNEIPVPDNAVLLGMVKVGDNGFSRSNNYSDVIGNATEEARKVGGNLIQLTKHKHPDFWSTTHRIKANIYYVENLEELEEAPEKPNYLTPTTAILHIYRSNSMGALLDLKLHLGDKLLCIVKNNWKMSIPVTTDGLNTLWIKTEKKTELPIKIEFGKEYYIRCAVNMGIVTGRAQLELINNKTGKLEFDAIKSPN